MSANDSTMCMRVPSSLERFCKDEALRLGFRNLSEFVRALMNRYATRHGFKEV